MLKPMETKNRRDKRAIFLDLDGVVRKEKNLFYTGSPVAKPEHFEWEIGSQEAMQKFSGLKDFFIVIITNQSQIGRNLLKKEDFYEINRPIFEEFRRYNRILDGLYFCPHSEQEKCSCRKPKIGMLLSAKSDLGIDLNRSWVIGDKTSDVKTGKNARCRTIMVRTGYGGRDRLFKVTPDFIVNNLLEAYYTIKHESFNLSGRFRD